MSAINCSAGLAVVVVNLDVAVAEIVLRSWEDLSTTCDERCAVCKCWNWLCWTRTPLSGCRLALDCWTWLCCTRIPLSGCWFSFKEWNGDTNGFHWRRLVVRVILLSRRGVKGFQTVIELLLRHLLDWFWEFFSSRTVQPLWKTVNIMLVTPCLHWQLRKFWKLRKLFINILLHLTHTCQ